MPPRVLSGRQLAVALLDRQWLLNPVAATPIDVMKHLVGMQAQSPDAPYYQLWSRIAGFDPDDLSRLLNDRAAVRVALMRGTIHLVAAADCMPLRAVVQPYLSRTLFNGSQSGRRITGIDPDELAAVATGLLATGPLTNDELATRLQEHWPGFDGRDLAYGARNVLPLVQVPPRGVWGQGGPLSYASAMQWLGTDMMPVASLGEIVLRYLAAFGPASVADFQRWSSLTRTKPVFDDLRDQLVSYRDESGRELFDLVDVELPDPDMVIAPMFIGPFDNLLLGHADKTRILSKEHERRIFGRNAVIRGSYLLDGRVAGAWKVDRTGKGPTRLRIEEFTPTTRRQRDELADRGEQLLSFAAGDADDHEVEFRRGS